MGVGWLVASPVPACQHALIWMFLFYCVCLFCVCILCSVVYQDGFYGADIYVSIIHWCDVACYSAISIVPAHCYAHARPQPSPHISFTMPAKVTLKFDFGSQTHRLYGT